MSTSLDDLLAKVARLETEDAEKDKRLRDLGQRVFRLEAQLRESALARDRLKAIATQLLLVLWAFHLNTADSPSALSEDVVQYVRNTAGLLGIPLAA